MPDRLPWHCDPDGSFVAHPEGEEHADRFARLECGGTEGTTEVWEWLLGYGKARRFGIAHSRDAAADAAADAWPSMRGEAAQLELAERAEAELISLIDAAVESGDLRSIHVEDTPYRLLIQANHHLREHLEARLAVGDDTEKVEAVMAIVSAETFIRRQRGVG
jgi:hypothetical protein